MKNHVDLIYKIEGDFSEGMDVNELAPLLLSVADLIRQSNEILKVTDRDIVVQIRPIKEGSFLMDIGIFASNNFQQILDGVNNEQIQNVKELLEIIGLTRTEFVGPASISLFSLIKWLNGKPKKIEKNEDGVTFTNQNGTQINVTGGVVNLFMSKDIQKSVSKALVKPLEDPRATAIRTGEKNASHDEYVEITRDDVESFKQYTDASFEEPEKVVTVSEMYLTVKTLQFESNSWKFNIDEGLSKWMTIEDEVFLKKVENREEPFYNGDIMRCAVETSTVIRDDKPHKTYVIKQVLEHKSAKRPQKLL